MLVGYVSDEYYAALADVLLEFRSALDSRIVARSSASGAIDAVFPIPWITLPANRRQRGKKLNGRADRLVEL
jgi:hypothetical protein